MPELPEVETVVRTLRPIVVGRRIVTVELGPHDVVTPDAFDLVAALTRQTIRSLDRRAKRIVFTMDDGNRFFIHLGMTGRLTVESASVAKRPHTHLVVTFEDPLVGPTLASPADVQNQSVAQLDAAGDASVAPTGCGGDACELRFVDPRRFGEIRWLGRAPDESTIGPEPLRMRASTFAKQLAKTRRAVKTALLDQQTSPASATSTRMNRCTRRRSTQPRPRANSTPIRSPGSVNRSSPCYAAPFEPAGARCVTM